MGIAQPQYIFGIDGGGTGCRVAICDASGKRIGEASGGPANYSTDSIGTIANVQAAVSRLAAAHSISPDDLAKSTARVGLAGILTDADATAMADALPFKRSIVSDDRETSLAGALGDANGILAAIGTGTFVAARSAETTRFFGGWGLHLSDQASGAWLGRKALRRTVLAHDGLASHSDLTQALLERTKDLTGMVAFAKDATPADYGSLARSVIQAAASGDANGLHIVKEGAAYLNACLNAVTLEGEDVICLTGGIGPHYEPYLETVFRDRVRPALGTALDGALRLAQQAFNKMEKAP
ncbi:MAG: N-acetylglucosamine kinase [Silicimonas sp.]|nr:N-acetylglucosamine kinase [Silicimonas sp.]